MNYYGKSLCINYVAIIEKEKQPRLGTEIIASKRQSNIAYDGRIIGIKSLLRRF